MVESKCKRIASVCCIALFLVFCVCGYKVLLICQISCRVNYKFLLFFGYIYSKACSLRSSMISVGSVKCVECKRECRPEIFGVALPNATLVTLFKYKIFKVECVVAKCCYVKCRKISRCNIFLSGFGCFCSVGGKVNALAILRSYNFCLGATCCQ